MNVNSISCQNCKQTFEIAPEDFLFYEKIKVPAPTWCPECRMIRRLVFRNHRFSFKRKNDYDSKEIFSGFPPEAPVKVYALDFWNSDEWEPMDYGKPYDFSKVFFTQIYELFLRVPLPARSVLRMVNSDYCDQASDMKNAYLCFNGSMMENSAYCVGCWGVKDSFDLYESRANEKCYNSVQVDDSFSVFFSFDCEKCSGIWFSKDMVGCTNCFGCVNLRNKSYYIFNEPYSKDDYFKKLKELDTGSYGSLVRIREKVREERRRYPVKYMHSYKNINSSGEHIQNSKNVRHSYTVHGGENLKYSQFLEEKSEDSYDYTLWGQGASLMYESLVCGEQCSGVKFSFDCWPSSRNLEYCISCRSSSDCFGCVGLKKKQYCIFNTQYSKEDYFSLREKIVAQMMDMPYEDKKGRVYRYGEFFPPEFSWFAYDETQASDFFPLDREQAEREGYIWRGREASIYNVTLPAGDIPDHIKDAPDSMVNEVIGCAQCGRAYRFIAPELVFCKQNGIPIPRMCPECRYKERFKLVNPSKFWHAKCQCAGAEDNRGIYQNEISHFHGANNCPNEFETSYSPDRPEIVYCEQCYNTEVVG